MAELKELNEKRAKSGNKNEMLKVQIQELTDFFENASVPLHRVNSAGIILWANQAELDLLGYSSEEYIGFPISRFHTSQNVIDDILNRLTNNDIIQNYPAQLICKNGDIKHVLISSSVYRKNGEFIHTRCFTRDITAINEEQEKKN